MKKLYSVPSQMICSASLPRVISMLMFFAGCLVSTLSPAQSYYPGGLGNTNLKLWLNAADSTSIQNQNGDRPATGDFVSRWSDRSGNYNHAYQNVSAAQPVYQTNLLNGKAAVIFQNANQILTGQSDAYQTLVAVRNLPGLGHYQTLFASPANTDFSVRGGGASSQYTDGPNVNDWTYQTGNVPTQWINGQQSLNGSSANQILVSTASAATNSTYSINSTFLSRGMNGNDAVYELLAYNGTLNTTQRQILENYESASWGLSSLLPASGYTLFSAPTALTYNQHLVGIGYTNSTDNFLANPTGGNNGSTDGLGFSSGTSATDFLHSAGFLMAAHNGQSATVKSNATVSSISTTAGGRLSLWNRSWYLQKSGGNTSGAVTLNFNFSDYSGNRAPSSSYIYGILYNATDGSFATGSNHIIKSSSTTITNSNVAFVVNAANLSNGYYTIIWSTTTILPIVLTEFNANKQGDQVQLTWTASDVTANSHFEIERKTSTTDFQVIGAVAANDLLTDTRYEFTDSKPAAGLNYYRLKIVEESLSYSAVHSIDMGMTQNVNLRFYPNPVKDQLQISATGLLGSLVIRLVSFNGAVLRSLSTSSASTITLPVSDIPSGLYVVEIIANGQKFHQEIVKI